MAATKKNSSKLRRRRRHWNDPEYQMMRWLDVRAQFIHSSNAHGDAHSEPEAFARDAALFADASEKEFLARFPKGDV